MLRKFDARALQSRFKFLEGWLSKNQSPRSWLGILPGLSLIGLTVIARLAGLFEPIELKTLDLFMRLRPVEPIDERVLVVGINDADIRRLDTYPVPDQTLTELLQKLEGYQPRAVGIDIVRDVPQEPGHQAFSQALRNMPHVFGIEILGSEGLPGASPPPALPAERVGVSDFPLDADGFVRRSQLGSFDAKGDYHYSLAVRLAKEYLDHEDILLDSGLKDPEAMRFGQTELPSFRENTGSYIRAQVGDQQTLLNVRNNPAPFRQVSLFSVLDNSIRPEWVQDKVVLIGITAASTKDLIYTDAIADENPGTVYGVVIHAHAVSQILSAVLNDRPLLKTWPEASEYLWILLWGMGGIFLIRRFPYFDAHVWVTLSAGVGLVGISYGALLLGWWIPIVPPLVVFLLNALIISRLQLYDRMMRSRIEAGHRVIRQTYSAMHNGPLQTLAVMMRSLEQKQNRGLEMPLEIEQLHHLNQEIRQLYTTLEEELEAQDNQFHLEQGLPALDLSLPLNELLYEVFAATLERDFPHFKSIKQRVIINFDEMQTQALEQEDKQSLCRFLEGALCNVGLHAKDATQLKVFCRTENDMNIIVVEDNGNSRSQSALDTLGWPSYQERWVTHTFMNRQGSGQGSREARRLASQLSGEFNRTRLSPSGVRCELKWPVHITRNRWLR